MFAKSRDKVDIYYESRGPADAPCVIFAHGAGGNAASWWQQVPIFAEKYRVITFDHRAFARSVCSADQFSVLQFENDALQKAYLSHRAWHGIYHPGNGV